MCAYKLDQSASSQQQDRGIEGNRELLAKQAVEHCQGRYTKDFHKTDCFCRQHGISDLAVYIPSNTTCDSLRNSPHLVGNERVREKHDKMHGPDSGSTSH